MQDKRTQSGRSLLETLSILVVMAILLLASVAGYNFVIHQWRKQQTVKQISELAVRYRVRPVQPGEGKNVAIKTIYPESERVDAVRLRSSDGGHVSLQVEDTSAFSVVAYGILEDSCESTLENGEYDGVRVNNKEVVIGQKSLKDFNFNSLSKEVQNALKGMEITSGTKKKEVISKICGSKPLTLVYGEKCPKMGGSWWYKGRCWSCPEGQTEDKRGKCCKTLNECGYCEDDSGYCLTNPSKCHGQPVCDADNTKTCVECVVDKDCCGEKNAGKKCTQNHCCPEGLEWNGIACACPLDKPKLCRTTCCANGCNSDESGCAKTCSGTRPACKKCNDVTGEWVPDPTQEGIRQRPCGKCDANGEIVEDKTAAKDACHECDTTNWTIIPIEGKAGWTSCGNECCEKGCDSTGQRCEKPECTKSEDCDKCKKCQNNKCVRDDSKCPEPKCTKDDDCGNCQKCDSITKQCIDNKLSDGKSCTGKQGNCCKSENCVLGLCCPEGQSNVNGHCCSEGISEGENCSAAKNCCLSGSCQENGYCCSKISKNSEICTSSNCCESGNCAGNSGNKHCCPAGFNYWIKACCKNDGTKNSVCTSDNCCNDGLKCLDDGTGVKKCQPEIPDCKPCSSEGQACTGDECNDLSTWKCDIEAGRCCPVGKKWLNGKCVSSLLCPDGLVENGMACASSECCTSGNCVKLDGEASGLCCASGETLIKNGNTYTCGKDCSRDFGKECSADNQCCGTQTCQQRFGRRHYETKKYQSCSCLHWHDYSCSDGCGGKATCSECTKYGTCETKEKQVLVEDDGFASKKTCCTGDGTLGSECSDECPCEGTAYIIDGKSDIVIDSREVYYKGCGCERVAVPLLYCRKGANGKGVCVKNSYKYNGTVIVNPETVNCANIYDFFLKDSAGKPSICYRCPEGTIVLDDSTSLACCTSTTTKYSSTQCSKQYSKMFYSTGKSDDYRDGYYYENGTWTACPKGSYCEDGVKYDCPAGSYNDITGQSTCKNCTVGNYCPKGCVKPIKCPIGSICPKVSMAEPQWCPAGTYMSGTGSSKTSCDTCKKGYFCPGGTTNIACKTGGAEVDAGEEADTKGYQKGYCPNTGMTAPLKGNSTNGSAQYVSSDTAVKICPKGSVCDGLDKVNAPLGTYVDVEGLSVAKTVSAGYCGANSSGACVTSGAVKQKACAKGYKGVGGECVKCEPGTYQDLEGQGTCKPCAEGTSSDAGAISCSKCTSGHFAKTSDTNTNCCTSGKVAVKNEKTGFETCCKPGERYCQKNTTWGCKAPAECTNVPSNCKANQYMDNGVCKACPADSGCNGTSAVQCDKGEHGVNGVCVPCAAGTYGSSKGVCSACTSNKITASTGLLSCEACPRGTIPNQEHSKCISGDVCSFGYALDSKSTKCSLICSSGQYYKDGVCNTCEMDHYCPDKIHMYSCETGKHATTGQTSCKKCTTNQFWNPNIGNCITKDYCPEGFQCKDGLVTSCPAGTTSAKGKVDCNVSCPANQYTNAGNKCAECSNGEWSNGGNANDCGKCPGGYYGLGKGKGCAKCPGNNPYGATGLTSSSGCKTCDGYVIKDGTECCAKGKVVIDGECKSCPTHATCPNWTTITCEAGYYKDGNSCKSCGTNKTSPAGSTSASACVCSPGYTLSGSSCVKCAKGTYKSSKGNGACTACPTNQSTASTGATSSTACVGCAGSKWWNNGVCSNCPTNATCNGTNFVCKADHYKNADKCTKCPGDRKSSAGSTSVAQCTLTCAQNKLASGDDCKTCPTGATCNGTSNFTCASNKIKTATGCSTCPSGATCNGSETFSCPAGKYRDGTSCKSCQSGTISAAGATSCTPCTGATKANTANTQCTACPAGKCANAAHTACGTKNNTYINC